MVTEPHLRAVVLWLVALGLGALAAGFVAGFVAIVTRSSARTDYRAVLILALSAAGLWLGVVGTFGPAPIPS